MDLTHTLLKRPLCEHEENVAQSGASPSHLVLARREVGCRGLNASGGEYGTSSSMFETDYGCISLLPISP